MKNKLFPIFVLTLLMVVAFSSCSKVPSSAKLIPKDVSCVMRIDVKQIAEKAEGEGDDNLKQMVRDEIKNAGMSRQATDLLLAIVEKPKKLGIDLRDPVFAYYRDTQPKGWNELFTEAMTDEPLAEFADSTGEASEPAIDNDDPEEDKDADGTDIDEAENIPDFTDWDFNEQQQNMEFGLVATIYDAEDLESVITTLRKELELNLQKAENNVRYLRFDNAVLVFNDDHLLFTTAHDGETEDALLTRAKQQLKQEKDNSIAGNDFFKKMCKKDGDLQVLFLGQAAASNPMYASMMLLFVDQECKLDDIAALLDCDMRDGETIITTEMLSASKAWDKEIKQWSKVMDDIDGDLCQYIDSEADLMLALHINGETLVKQIEHMPVMKMLPQEMKKSIFPMLKSFQGDATMGMNFDAKTGKLERFCLYAHTENSKLAKLIATDLFEGEAKQVGKELYRIDDDSMKVDFGWKDGLLFCTSGDGNKPFDKAGKAFDKSLLKGKKTYCRFNFNIIEKIGPSPNDSLDVEELMLRQFLSKFESLEMFMKDERISTLRLINKDKKQNLLGILSSFIRHLPEEMMQGMSKVAAAEPDSTIIEN